MKDMRFQYSIEVLSNVFNVSPSGYYDWETREPSARKKEDIVLKTIINEVHEKTRKCYGVRRLKKELHERKISIGKHRLARLRRELGITSRQKKSYKKTTNSNHDFPIAPNILDQNFQTERPNQVWVTDITYIPTNEGWLYLSGVKDLFTCEIVGYSFGSRMTQDLVHRSIIESLKKAKPGRDLIHHSDRGSQYCADGYRKLLDAFGFKVSMSRKGNCYDNAPMESFWGSLKTELTHHKCYKTREEAIQDITEYIEVFYNRQRRHSRLGNVSPATFIKHYNRLKAAS